MTTLISENMHLISSNWQLIASFMRNTQTNPLDDTKFVKLHAHAPIHLQPGTNKLNLPPLAPTSTLQVALPFATLGLPEQVLGWFPLGSGSITETYVTELSCSTRRQSSPESFSK